MFATKGMREIHSHNAGESQVINILFQSKFIQTKSLATSPAPDIIDPCRPSPCGINAECRERNGAASCKCLPGLQGNPYIECKPECTINSECPDNRACIQNKCKDPCPGVCGRNAFCSVQNHNPICRCDPGYTGDPFRACNLITTRKHVQYLGYHY